MFSMSLRVAVNLLVLSSLILSLIVPVWGQGAGTWTIYPRTHPSPSTGELRFREIIANGYHYVGFKAPSSITANKIWTLPATDGSAGQALTTNGSGILSWAAAGGVPWVNVKDFGAVGDGASHPISSTSKTVADFPNVPGVASSDEVDWAAAQEALYSRPATGGCVWMPAGTYVMNKELVVGNGEDTQSTDTTANDRTSQLNGQCLFGDGMGFSSHQSTTGTTVIKKTTSLGAVLRVNGMIYSTRVSHLTLDGNNISQYGLHIRSSWAGLYHSIQIRNVVNTGMWLTARRTHPIPGGTPNSEWWRWRGANCVNSYKEIHIDRPDSGTTNGLYVSGDMNSGGLDTCSSSFEDFWVQYGGSTGSYGLKIDYADNNLFRRMNFGHWALLNGGIGFTGGTGILFANYSGGGVYQMPYENQFEHVLAGSQGWGGNAGTGGNIVTTGYFDCDPNPTDLCTAVNVPGLAVRSVRGEFLHGWKFRRGINASLLKTEDRATFSRLSMDLGADECYVPNEAGGSTYVNGTGGCGWTFNPGARRLYVLGKDTFTGAVFQSFNQFGVSFLKGVGSRGTSTTPAASQNDDQFLSLAGSGHNGVGFLHSGSGALTINTTENWTTTANGTEVRIEVTPNGSTTRRRSFAFRNLGNTPEMFFIDGGTNVYEGGIRYNASSRTMQFRHDASVSWVDFAGSTNTSLFYGYPGGCDMTQAHNGNLGCGFTITNSGQANTGATVVHVQSTADQAAGFAAFAYNGNVPFIKLHGIGGTVASPTFTGSGAQIGSYGGVGWSGSGALGSASGALTINTTESWQFGGKGTEIRVETTSTGETSRRRTIAFQNDGANPQMTFINGTTNEGGFRWNAATLKLQFKHTGAGTWTDIGAGAGGGYTTVADEGGGLTPRTTINFTGTGVTCSDNSINSRTDCSIASGGGSVDFTNIASQVLPSSDGSFSVGSSTRRWGEVVAVAMTAKGSNITVLDNSNVLRASMSTFGFYGYDSTGAQRVALDTGNGLSIRSAALGALMFEFTTSGTVTTPSGFSGYNGTISCPAGQAMKSINVSAGFVTGGTCGEP